MSELTPWDDSFSKAPERIWVEHHGPDGNLSAGGGEMYTKFPVQSKCPVTAYTRTDIQMSFKVIPLVWTATKGGAVAQSICGEFVMSFDGHWCDEEMQQDVQVDTPWGEVGNFTHINDAEEWADEKLEERILLGLQLNA